jgi:hypothetical protein
MGWRQIAVLTLVLTTSACDKPASPSRPPAEIGRFQIVHVQDATGGTVLLDTVSGTTFYLVSYHTKADPKGPEVTGWYEMPRLHAGSPNAETPANSN